MDGARLADPGRDSIVRGADLAQRGGDEEAATAGRLAPGEVHREREVRRRGRGQGRGRAATRGRQLQGGHPVGDREGGVAGRRPGTADVGGTPPSGHRPTEGVSPHRAGRRRGHRHRTCG